MTKRNLKKDKPPQEIISNPVMIKFNSGLRMIEFKKWNGINLN